VNRTTSVEELKQEAIAFRDARDWKQFHDAKNLAMGMAVECAELQELFLWKSAAEVTALLATPAGQERASEELADVFIYLLYLSEACGVDLSEAVGRKLMLNEARYPVDKTYGSHKKYTELSRGDS
jgi:NTP pyrophosphatase (non-canonical NTP hydrolase)